MCSDHPAVAARLLLPLAAALVIGCGDDDDDSSRMRVSEKEPRERLVEGRIAASDEETVIALREPRVAGRIIYDPPPDLSYASAQRLRPDLVKPDTMPRRDTSTARVRRDTTAGDAAADTSGGAARTRRP